MASCLCLLIAGMRECRGSSDYGQSTMFDPTGRLVQVERAYKASSRGGSVIAVKSDEYIVLVVCQPRDEFVYAFDSKVKHLTDSICMAAAGIIPDVNNLADLAFRETLGNMRAFDKPPTISRLASSLASHMQSKTVSSASRPYGATLCLCGYEAGRTRMYEVSPSGSFSERSVSCLGLGNAKLSQQLAKQYQQQLSTSSITSSSTDSSLSVGRLLELCVGCLQRCLQGTGESGDSEGESGSEGESWEPDPLSPFLDRNIEADDLYVYVIGKGLKATLLDPSCVREVMQGGDFGLVDARVKQLLSNGDT